MEGFMSAPIRSDSPVEANWKALEPEFKRECEQRAAELHNFTKSLGNIFDEIMETRLSISDHGAIPAEKERIILRCCYQIAQNLQLIKKKLPAATQLVEQMDQAGCKNLMFARADVNTLSTLQSEFNEQDTWMKARIAPSNGLTEWGLYGYSPNEFAKHCLEHVEQLSQPPKS
jgi:hypothetical protein